jgi:hypothetical protein
MAVSYSTSSMLVALCIFVATFGCSAGTGDLHCYDCNSANLYQGDKCKEIKPNADAYKDLLSNCTEQGIKDNMKYERCRTMVQDVEGDTRIVRSCATWPDRSKGSRCIDRTGTSKIKIHYCECEGYACNRAITLCSSALALVLAMLVGRANL